VARRTRTVLPKAFGVKLVDTDGHPPGPTPRFVVEHLVHANDSVPTGPQLLDAVTVHDGQTTIEIELNEQAGTVESDDVRDNTPVPGGHGMITGLPPLPAGSPVRIALAVDEDGLLQLQATELTHGRTLRILVGVGVLSEAEVGAATDIVARMHVSGRALP
jgi:molecular chaperone DnaK